MATSPSRSPLRTGGIALLGVGIIAATVGLFTSVTNGTEAGTAVPSASAQALPATAEPVVPAEPPATAPVVVPETAPAVAPPVAAPPVAAPPVAEVPGAAAAVPPAAAAAPPAAGAAPRPESGAGAGSDVAKTPLRVYNNSLIQGLAAKAKSDFEAAGWTVTNTAGFPGSIPHSTAYFRPGTGEEAAAQELGREFGLHVEPRFAGLDEATPGVIVIVTQDYTAGKR